jgi:hypothetical protein
MFIEQPDLQQQIIARAMKDEAFRHELTVNPKTVLERELGIELPPNVSVMVHENTSSTIHLVLPMKPKIGGVQELSDEELGRIVGGDAIPQPTGLHAIEYLNQQQ